MFDLYHKLNVIGRPQLYFRWLLGKDAKESLVKKDSILGMPQVHSDYYTTSNYDSFENWSHYWSQINAVQALNPQSVLEIGKGNGTVSNYLATQTKLDVTTFDFDAMLQPDVTGDVREINRYFKPKSFDVVLCSQVLEHFPFEYFIPTLDKIFALCNKGLIIGLPRYGRTLCFHFLFGRIQFRFYWMIPKCKMLKRSYPFSGGHYWEINTSGIDDKTILKILHNYFRHVKEINVWGNPWLVIYICNGPI